MPDEGIYTQRDPFGLAGGNPTIYGYVNNPNWYIDPLGLWVDEIIDWIVTPNGTVIPANQNIDLVSTTVPTNQGGDWFQIHVDHIHDGNQPHTYSPHRHSGGSGGSASRMYRNTIAEDFDFASDELSSGRMRQRRNRRDKGGFSSC